VGVYFASSRKGGHSILYGSLTILMIAGLLVTQNRASILGLIIGMICLILFSLKTKAVYKIAISMVAIAGFAGFVMVIAPSLRSLTTRLHLWNDAMQLVNENPVFGSGLETFRLVFQKVTSAEFFELEKIYSIADRAHNEFLDIVIMQGSVGLIIFLSIILGIFSLVLKHKNKLTLTLCAALISILVSNFFSFSLVVHYLLFMALLAILLNQLLKFKNIKIRQSFLTVLTSGGLFALSIVIIFNSISTIHADNQFKSGMDRIYAGEVDQGLSRIIGAANLNVHQGDIFFHLSDILFLMGRQLEDESILQKASDIVDYAGDFTNNDFRYYFAKARIFTYLGNYEEAQEYYLHSSDLAPINPIVMKEWGVMYYEKGDYEAAIGKLELFLGLIPDHWKNKIKLKELDPEIQEEYRLFMKHIPDLWDVFAYLARSHAELGNIDKANYYLEFVEDIDARTTVGEILTRN
ncbi:MAG: O-antigen ligase family protein, partial [bacterium]|nr:O-antigen ligase family protein [bacterium]